MVKKMRVTLLDESLITISDRLVGQNLELDNGPTEKHKGPLKLEVVLQDKDDVDKVKAYIDRLVGDLPLPVKKIYGKKDQDEPDLAPVEDYLKEVTEQCKTQTELIKKLRGDKFVFLDSTYMADFGIPINLDPKHAEKYQFMVRQLKEAKNPKADKWDPQLAFGIKLIGKKVSKVQVYLYSDFKETLEMPIGKEELLKPRKQKFTKFPPYMTEEERLKYQIETRTLANNKDKSPSKFYKRWTPDVERHNKELQ